ncbi:MAG: sialate O-acetylesterase, partial [Phycisphaerales bacterium JB038]
LDTPEAGGPYEIRISGDNDLTLDNILIGEVWVCSGQSNMEWPMRKTDNAQQEIAAADYPEIRLFQVKRAVAMTPQDDCEGAWTECHPEAVAEFSAVAYFFGRKLHRELDVPIGLIHTSWGGTLCEAWTSVDTLASKRYFAEALKQIELLRQDSESLGGDLPAQQQKWWATVAEKDPGSAAEGGFSAADFDDSAWPTMTQPSNWQGTDLAGFDGIAWLRTSVELPEDWAGQELTVNLSPIDDMDAAYFNGTRVGGIEEIGYWNRPRSYTVPGNLVQAGVNTIAVRVVDTGGLGGMTGPADAMHLHPAGDASQRLSLAGDWRYQQGVLLKNLPAFPTRPSFHQNSPTALFNGMLTPVIPFGMKGAIWYQGESNRMRAYQYRELLPSMIEDWRMHWGQGDFPFYFVQIAPFLYGNDEGEAAELREAQLMTLQTPNTGMAVTMDIGNPRDIHPSNKQDVGHRLALWALAKDYGYADLVYSGPLYSHCRREPNGLRLYFDHVGSGLKCEGAALTHFQIAGPDRKFLPARAEIQGDTVFVWSDQVRKPLAVRYGWGAADEPNLCNQEGLPASSFRTDDWTMMTQ